MAFNLVMIAGQQQQQEPSEQTQDNSITCSQGWKTAPLHVQTWAQANMKASFQQRQSKWQHCLCAVCNEQWPVRTRLNVVPFVCVRKRDMHAPKLFSECLKGMTQVEETVYHKHGGQTWWTERLFRSCVNHKKFRNL